MKNKKENILIIGAGLCGSILALRLGQRGYQVTLIEKRPDLRKIEQDAGRSINLAFSDRGLKAMKMVGLENEVEKLRSTYLPQFCGEILFRCCAYRYGYKANIA